jgi:glycosyltransferase involved in cell wall biosynthesis
MCSSCLIRRFQSGVLFLGYGFGLPVIATDVGSLKDDIVEVETGFLSPPNDPALLATAIETYFDSDLFKNLERQRAAIRDYARARDSSDVVGRMTTQVYTRLVSGELPLPKHLTLSAGRGRPHRLPA